MRLLVAGTTPLAPDEAYYWVWSRALAPGYLDHPPMVALWIRAGTALAGHSAFGVRLLSPLAAAFGSLLLADAANALFPSRRPGVLAAVLLNATLLFSVGAVTMTPDTPLLLFWTATLWALAHLAPPSLTVIPAKAGIQATRDVPRSLDSRLRGNDGGAGTLANGALGWWLLAGLFAGLALDSKYTGLLLAPIALLWLAWVPSLRPWLRRPAPWLAALFAAICFAPVIAWNAAHGWAGFVKQGGRAADWAPARALQFLGELVGGQIGLATPLLAILFAAGLVVAGRKAWRGEPAWALLAAFALLPAGVFVQHALGDRVQANWPAVLYPAAAVAAALVLPRWHRPAIALGFALTALVYLQATLAPFPLPAKLDPTLARLGGWSYLAADIELAADATHADFIAVENYGAATELARALPADLPVVGIDPRWALFGLPDASRLIAGHAGLLLRPARDAAPRPEDWFAVGSPLPAARARAGVVAEEYRLYPVVGRAGITSAVALPRRP